jgi:hypothetical protein
MNLRDIGKVGTGYHIIEAHAAGWDASELR